MKNIVETAIEAGSFKKLVQAIEAAGLAEFLSGKGPYTVCAPNDEAFSALPKETFDSLLKDKEGLQQVLKYHVASGKAMSSDVMNMKSVKTLQGEELQIDTSRGVKIGDAHIIQPDIECSNGVIHVIDMVLIPKAIQIPKAPR